MKEIERQPQSLKFTIKLKKKNIASDCLSNGDLLNKGEGECPQPSDSASYQEDFSSSIVDNHKKECNENPSSDNNPYQLVLYDPSANGVREIETAPDPIGHGNLSFPKPHHFSTRIPRVLPSIGAFTVQCANCYKWRLIPTKEKYEEIREHIIEQPFVCETAREWRSEISCNDPPDITQDGSRLWAIDKPSIAQPPPGWQRLLRIRGEGSSKFADVYYVAPSGKRLRSMVEIQRYLDEHPQYIQEGVRLSQFSFRIPKPLQEDYVRKRPARATVPVESQDQVSVKAITWVTPDVDADLHLNESNQLATDSDAPKLSPESQLSKKKKAKLSEESFNGDIVVYNRLGFEGDTTRQV